MMVLPLMAQEMELVSAATWNMGSTEKERNLLVSQPFAFTMSSNGSRKKPIGAKRFFWLSMTPLLRPVVPEVNRITLSASTSGHSSPASLHALVV